VQLPLISLGVSEAVLAQEKMSCRPGTIVGDEKSPGTPTSLRAMNMLRAKAMALPWGAEWQPRIDCSNLLQKLTTPHVAPKAAYSATVGICGCRISSSSHA
jgi:hypothetical protein